MPSLLPRTTKGTQTMNSFKSPRPRFWSSFFIGLVAVLGFILVRRYTMGLGAISNLNDQMPWGL